MTRVAILDFAYSCAMRHHYTFRGYETLEKSVAALHRRCRGVSMVRLQNAFVLAQQMYIEAERLVVAEHKSPDHPPDEALRNRLRSKYPMFHVATIESAMKQAWFYRIVR